MLFKTRQEVATYFPIDANLSLDILTPFIIDAESNYLLKVLGMAQLDALQAAVNAGTFTPQQTALLQKVRPALIKLALYLAAPNLAIRWSNLGLMKTDSADYSNATGGEVYFARTQLLIDGYRGLDNLYAFLELNKADYPDWTASTAYSEYKKYFLNTALAFDQYCNIRQSRWLYVAIISIMDTQEQLRVAPAIGQTFWDTLKTKFAAGTLTTDEQTVVEKLRKPIALYTYAAALQDPAVREIIRIITATTADELSRRNTTETDYKSEYDALAQNRIDEANALIQLVLTYLNNNASSMLFADYYSSDKYKDPNAATPKMQDYNNNISNSTFALI